MTDLQNTLSAEIIALKDEARRNHKAFLIGGVAHGILDVAAMCTFGTEEWYEYRVKSMNLEHMGRHAKAHGKEAQYGEFMDRFNSAGHEKNWLLWLRRLCRASWTFAAQCPCYCSYERCVEPDPPCVSAEELKHIAGTLYENNPDVHALIELLAREKAAFGLSPLEDF